MLEAYVFAIMSPRNNKLAIYLKFVGVDHWGGGNSIVFHLSFLTHSACQYDVTYVQTCKLARDTTVIWTSEDEEKLRS